MEPLADKVEDVTAAAPASDLPMRKDAPLESRTAPEPHKDINKTTGGRLVNGGIYYGLGWLGNSILALYFTYALNPLKSVTEWKERQTERISGMLKGKEFKEIGDEFKKYLKSSPELRKVMDKDASFVEKIKPLLKTYDNVRSTVEILFMFISGTILTLVMTPLVTRRGKLAHTVNQWLGNKDKDVLPDDARRQAEPKTVEDKIEQEIKQRVNKHHSTGDLWKSRVIMMGLILGGDNVVNRISRMREEVGKESVDTLAWRLGQKIHDKLQHNHPEALQSWINFFEKHGAKFEEVKESLKKKYEVLEKTEFKLVAPPGMSFERAKEEGILKELLNTNRMVISEQTRLVTKEMGWTMVMAVMLHQFVHLFNKHRVKKEEARAIAEITKEGLVPEGYKVVLEEGVKLEKINPPAKDASWTAKTGSEKARPEKSASFIKAVDNSRTDAVTQPSL